MIPIDDEFATVLKSSHEVEYRAQALRGPEVTLESVPITSDGTLTFTAGAAVQCNGSVFLAKGDDDSLVPKSKSDPLAPFGQELRVTRVDKIGTREWLTPMGQLRITGVPSMKEFFLRYPTRAKLVGWSAQLNLSDRFEAIIADEFLYPDEAKPARTSWQEIQRLSPFPIVRNDALPDVAVPVGLAYPESRMDAITLLFSNLGAYPHLRRTGELTGRVKDAWLIAPAPVFTIEGVISMDDSLSNDLYNAVRVKSSAGDNDLVAVREILDRGNPINVVDMGRRVMKIVSQLDTTQTAINATAERALVRVSTRQAQTVKVTCLPQPHLELGDYIRAIDTISGREVDGEISRMSFSFNPTSDMTLELIAAETR